jgi:heat shock protein HspQ
MRPHKDQPFYHLFAENDSSTYVAYVAYVSEQNLLADDSGKPLRHPDITDHFVRDDRGKYRLRARNAH